MLKLKPQYFRHLMRRTDSFEKTLILGRIDGGRRRGWQKWGGWMISPTQWTWVWVNSGSWWWIGRPGMLLSMGSQRVGHDWATELKWTEMCQFIYPIDGLCCGHYDSWSVGSDQGSLDRNQESTCHNPDGATAARLSPRLCDPWQVAYLLCASVSSSVKQGC